jgi:uncharacterized protein YbgA (DUF1722 family)/uncharacterized protein YbbK (DUF523 family)
MKIGVSSCLLGQMCRYNGGHAKDDFIVDVLHKYFEIVPYCPEAIVFGTPRESIRIVEENGIQKVVTTKDKVDVTKPLQDICNTQAIKIADDALCGFILKSASPTCGLERVKVYDKHNTSGHKRGIGLFAEQIKNRYPYLPVEEEGRLQDAWLRENFIMQVFAYKHLHDFLATNPSAGELVKFHTSYKYLIYAKSQASYKSLGNIVANHEKLSIEELREVYKEEFLKAISKKGTIKKTYNVLLHLFGYFKKSLTKEEKQEVLTSIEEFKDGIIPLITIIKIIKLYVVRFDIEYLKTQKFLTPYPKELALRSSLKAYK